MSDVFISHSSEDKIAVRRLADYLRNNGVTVWLDEWEIEVGDPIVEKVSSGLQEAKYVAIWLSKNAVNSGWVTAEWQSKVYQEVSDRQVYVLPLLGEYCDIPFFLSQKKYADFTKSFDEGASALIKKIKKIQVASSKIETDPNESIMVSTKRFLCALEDCSIPFPTQGKLKIIPALKTIPRSGKLLRLDIFSDDIEIRSIYDHLLSVAHTADCLLQENDYGIVGRHRVELARFIAFHDVCEVLLGDVPQYTHLNHYTRNKAKVEAQIRLARLHNGEPEKIANQFIAMYLPESTRESFLNLHELMKTDNPVRRFATVLDKIDPIIATWRYIHILRNEQWFDTKVFVEEMIHFFDNPQVKKTVSRVIKNSDLVELVAHLQTPVNARIYGKKNTMNIPRLFPFSEEFLKQIIEGRGFEYAPKTYEKRFRRNRQLDIQKKRIPTSSPRPTL